MGVVVVLPAVSTQTVVSCIDTRVLTVPSNVQLSSGPGGLPGDGVIARVLRVPSTRLPVVVTVPKPKAGPLEPAGGNTTRTSPVSEIMRDMPLEAPTTENHMPPADCCVGAGGLTGGAVLEPPPPPQPAKSVRTRTVGHRATMVSASEKRRRQRYHS